MLFDRLQPRLFNKIGLVQQKNVAIDNLGATDLAVEQLVVEIFGVYQGDDRVQPGLIAQFAAEKRHGHGKRVRQPCCFNHQVINGIGAFQDPIHRLEKLPVDGAADASVAELHHVVTGAHHQIVVDPDLSELVDQHSRLDAVLIAEDVVEQSGLAGTKEAREDRHRHTTGGDRRGAGGHSHGRGGRRRPDRPAYPPIMSTVWARVGQSLPPGRYRGLTVR